MATDFWASSHHSRWIVDRATIRRARQEDAQYVDDPDHLGLLGIFFANLISKLGTKLSLRQRVIATASVFFKRFYLKNLYCETDPYLVLVACCYLAAKAEESPMHIKHIVTEARSVLNEYGIKHFPTDNSKLAEMEFYLMDDLECDLVVFHPYRTLATLVKDQCHVPENEVGDWGVGVEERSIRNGGEPRLLMHAGGIQNAWFLINDLYGSDLCLLYPPHLIAIAALYLSCILHNPTRQAHLEWMESRQQPANNGESPVATRRSLRHSNNSGSGNAVQTQTAASSTNKQKGVPQDFVGFFASLNVNMSLVGTIAQEIISFYSLCQRFSDDNHPGSVSQQSSQFFPKSQTHNNSTSTNPKNKSRSQTSSAASAASRSGSRNSSGTPVEVVAGASTAADVSISISVSGKTYRTGPEEGAGIYEVNSLFLIQLLVRMRAMREADLAHPASGRPVGQGQAVNKVLERAQAAG